LHIQPSEGSIKPAWTGSGYNTYCRLFLE